MAFSGRLARHSGGNLLVDGLVLLGAMTVLALAVLTAPWTFFISIS